MRLTQKKIEEILVELLGEEGLPLIKQLCAKDNTSEFELATKTKKDIKVIRKMLYALYNRNLVGFTRKKDKIKGWYIYYWTLLPESIRFNYYQRKREFLENLRQRLEEEKKEMFFICPSHCVRLNFDQSMDLEFHCPECGELVSHDNGEKRIVELEKQIHELGDELAEVEKELKARLPVEKKKPLKSKKVLKVKKKGLLKELKNRLKNKKK